MSVEIMNSFEMQGQVLKHRFMVSHPLDEGCFGNIYECIDLNQPTSNYVIKVSASFMMLGIEIKALSDLKHQLKSSQYIYPYEYIPRSISKGMFLIDTKMRSNNTAKSMEVSK